MDVSFRTIAFESQGAVLRGRLYVPKEDSTKRHPIIVMAHGFTSTINHMTADNYAERFREAGFAILLYDHRNLGISGGEPRQEINFWVQSRGYIDAIDFVHTLEEIDPSKIAIWGASMSAREAFLVGSIDERIAAIITLIPAFGDTFPKEDQDSSRYALAKDIILSKDIFALPHTKSKPMAVVSHDQIGAPSKLKELTAFRWFIEYGGRFGTQWKNEVSFSTIETPEDFHIGQCAPHLNAPILMIVAKNDEMTGASPEVTRELFQRIDQPKKWVYISGGHFGLLYYPSILFEESIRAQIKFLQENLIYINTK